MSKITNDGLAHDALPYGNSGRQGIKLCCARLDDRRERQCYTYRFYGPIDIKFRSFVIPSCVVVFCTNK